MGRTRCPDHEPLGGGEKLARAGIRYGYRNEYIAIPEFHGLGRRPLGHPRDKEVDGFQRKESALGFRNPSVVLSP